MSIEYLNKDFVKQNEIDFYSILCGVFVICLTNLLVFLIAYYKKIDIHEIKTSNQLSNHIIKMHLKMIAAVMPSIGTTPSSNADDFHFKYISRTR